MTKRRLILLSWLLLPGILWAQNSLPSYYPEEIPRTGTLDRLDLKERVIVVNDALYRLAQYVPVHTPRRQVANLGDLKEGDKITFEYKDRKKVSSIITEIWKLPKSHKESEE